jgi:hypothetical protein
MAFRRGFKTEATATADEIRRELGRRPFDSLDPIELAECLAIPVWTLSEFVDSHPAIAHLLNVEPNLFSAVTVFAGPRRTIVHNDAHLGGRQNSNLAHELAHGLLHHLATPALDDKMDRLWNQDIEDEAAYLGGALLVTEAMTISIAEGRLTKLEAAVQLGVSPQMIQYRLNCTGAVQRVERMRKARGR